MKKILFFVQLICANAFSLNYFSTDDAALTKNHVGVQSLLRQNADVIEIPSVRRTEMGQIGYNTRIFDNEYRGLSKLKYVEFPDTVKALGESAFRDCDLHIVLLNKVDKIGYRCFSGNHMLELVVMPTCPNVDSMCFAECGDYSDNGLTIVCQDPTSVKSIQYKFGNWNCQVMDFFEAVNCGLDSTYGVDLRKYIW